MLDPFVGDARRRMSAVSRPAGSATRDSVMHFGVRATAKKDRGLRMTRDTYSQINKRSSSYIRREQVSPEFWDWMSDIYEDEDHRFHTDEWCLEQQAATLRNYDLNIAFFESLTHAHFDNAVTMAVTAQRGMVEVKDLFDWGDKPSLYVMVLDGYCQAYVGITRADGGVMKRIQKHWTTKKPFDRLLFGGVDKSILSIDSFRALDTTRIFAIKTSKPEALEDKVIQSFPAKYLLNRLRGGDARLVGLAHLAGESVMRQRELSGDQPQI